MTAAPVVHATFAIEKNYPVRPEKVFAAFSSQEKKRRWYAQSSTHDVITYEMDFRVGGVDRGSYRFTEETPFPGAILNNAATYQDIVPDQRIVVAYTMAFGEKRFSSSLATFEFFPMGDAGTKLLFTEQAAFFEGGDGPQMREGGWRHLLDSLGRELLL